MRTNTKIILRGERGLVTLELKGGVRVHQLEIPVIGRPGLTSNVYIIEGDRLFLVDTGCLTEETEHTFKKKFFALGLRLSDIEKIFLTHGHVDHYGFAGRLSELTGAEIFIHEDDLGSVRNVHANFSEDFEVTRTLLKKIGMTEREIEETRDVLREYGKYGQNLEKCKVMEDGQVFSYGKGTLRVVHSPGHSPGSACFYDEVNKILFTGDHLLTDCVPHAVIEPITSIRDRKYKSLVCYIDSLQKIAKLPVDYVLPGHGTISGSFEDTLIFSLDHYKKLKSSVLEVLGFKSVHPADIAHTIDPELKGIYFFLLVSDVWGILDILEEERLIKFYDKGDDIYVQQR